MRQRAKNASGGKHHCGHCRNNGLVELDPKLPDTVTIDNEPDDPTAEAYVFTARWADGTFITRVKVMPDTAAANAYADQLRLTSGVPYGAPCPMCEIGLKVEHSMYPTGYWTQKRLADTSWNHGLTWQHSRRCRLGRDGEAYPCGQPAREQWCDYHTIDTNRVPHTPQKRPKFGDVFGSMAAQPVDNKEAIAVEAGA